MYPVVDVDGWEVHQIEPGGDEAKLWLIDPVPRRPVGRDRWLFKPATVKEVHGGHLYRRGEDWAEKICAELAAIVGLPAARVDLARRFSDPGSMSLDLKPYGWELQTGGVSIAAVDDRYRPRTEADKRPNPLGHNLENIETVLEGVSGPHGTEFADRPAFELFVGFLVFDAWVANTDRHEQNWAYLRDPEGKLELAPTFDHGSALASRLTDDARASVRDMARWCRRGFAGRFEDMQKTTLLEFARLAHARLQAGDSVNWFERIAAVTDEQCHAVVTAVPSMSALTRRFTMELLARNRERMASGDD